MATVEFQSHDVWTDSFDEAEQQHLQDEDSAALSSVSTILMFIVSVGLVLGVFSVLVILATS